MQITEVIDCTILAIYSEPSIAKEVVVKGGTALRLMENIDIRLSTDLDFSIEKAIASADVFFPKIEKSLAKRFSKSGFDVIDFAYKRKPNKRGGIPDWWSGWLCTFKLSSTDKRGQSKENRSRSALMPAGSNTTIIEIEISEYEYCKVKRTKTIKGVRISGYTRELLVLEKIRALCQQHPTYKLASSKNRARDFVDIYYLTQELDEHFLQLCRKHIGSVFSAKEVPLDLLTSFWDEPFLDLQRRGFAEVQDTAKEKLQPFDVYVENLRYLIKQIQNEV